MELNDVKQIIDVNLKQKVTELKQRTKSLSNILKNIEDKTNKDGINVSVNKCGETQSTSANIDLLCVEITTLQEVKKLLDSVN